MTAWRFDQGRLDYFQFDEVRRMARALVEVDGIAKPSAQNDVLREVLVRHSPRPFAPAGYTVWRNYKRVFGCLMLATDIAGRIVCTDLCRKLATTDMDGDDYLAHFARRFSYPSPVFEGYAATGTQTFPVVAIIKLLLSEFLTKGKPYVSVDEIGALLIANQVSGQESLAHFASLTLRTPPADLRQCRELVRFISQFSFLKWESPRLYLEVAGREECLELEQRLIPEPRPRNPDAGAELLALGEGFSDTTLGSLTLGHALTASPDAEFAEGSRTRSTHLRSERSAKLREFYFAAKPNPHLCDMCAMDTLKHYPWVERLVELHHLLPLSSPIRVERAMTSIHDVVGLCPSCHRATHRFYGQWLSEHRVKDFSSPDQAREVYGAAKGLCVTEWRA